MIQDERPCTKISKILEIEKQLEHAHHTFPNQLSITLIFITLYELYIFNKVEHCFGVSDIVMAHALGNRQSYHLKATICDYESTFIIPKQTPFKTHVGTTPHCAPLLSFF